MDREAPTPAKRLPRDASERRRNDEPYTEVVDGIHDLGGMQGFGRVAHPPAEPAFHEPWEANARAMAMIVVGTLKVSGGEFRHSIERMDPGHYLTSSYYEHWVTAAATLAVEHGLVTQEVLDLRAGGPFPVSRPVTAEPQVDVNGDTALAANNFLVGDRVRVRDWHPPGHTRCPRYVRGRTGTITRVDVEASLPDVEAHTKRRVVERTYSVAFDAADLWHDGQRGVFVHVDLWASYLERS